MRFLLFIVGVSGFCYSCLTIKEVMILQWAYFSLRGERGRDGFYVGLGGGALRSGRAILEQEKRVSPSPSFTANSPGQSRL